MLLTESQACRDCYVVIFVVGSETSMSRAGMMGQGQRVTRVEGSGAQQWTKPQTLHYHSLKH